MNTSNSFKFGSGKIFSSLYKDRVPATIGDKDVFIESDLVESDIPMLLSKTAMKRANTNINFKNETVNIFGQKQKLLLTSSGHYTVPLNKSSKILASISTQKQNIILHTEALKGDKLKIALKLHSQFSHPSSEKLIQLINNLGYKKDF